MARSVGLINSLSKLLLCMGAFVLSGSAQAPDFIFDQKNRIELLVFSSDEHLLASITGYDLSFYNTETGKLHRTLETSGYFPNSAIFSNDGRYFFTGSNDGKVRLFETHDFSIQKIFPVSKWSVYALAISHNNQAFAVDASDGTIDIWNISSGERHRSLGKIGPRPQFISFSKSGGLLATTSIGSELRLFNVVDLSETFSIKRSSLGPLVFCGQSGELAITTYDSVDFIKTDTGGLLRSIKIPREIVPFIPRPNGMGGAMAGRVILSPDCRTIAVNNWKTKTITLLDADTVKVRKVLLDPEAKESSYTMVFSASGGFIATGSTSGKIRLWRAK